MKKIILPIGGLLACFIIQAQVSAETFEEALGLQTNFTQVKKMSENMYLVGQPVDGEHPTDPTLVRSITLTSVLQNNGDHYVMATNFQSLVPSLYDELTGNEKYQLGDLLAHHFGKDANFKIEKGEKSNPIATIPFTYQAKKPLGVMTNLVKNHNKMTKSYLGLVAQHQKLFLKTKKEKLKQPLTSLDNEWFPYYVEEERLFDWAKEPDMDEAIGYWSYQNNSLELSYDLYNFPDRFEMYITGYVEKEDVAKGYLEAFENFTSKKGQYPGASASEASLRPGAPTYVGTKITWLYDGEMNLGDFVESYSENEYKYGQKMNKVY